MSKGMSFVMPILTHFDLFLKTHYNYMDTPKVLISLATQIELNGLGHLMTNQKIVLKSQTRMHMNQWESKLNKKNQMRFAIWLFQTLLMHPHPFFS
jgi:hypothetical protein